MRPVEEWLAREIGLDVLSVGRQALAAAIARRMDHCSLRDPSAYVRLLTGSREERVALIDAVVVPETWFFRDRGPFEHLVRHVTQVWLPAHRSGSLLILSVPCSTGEEPYSIAMALLDAGLRPGSFRIEASDISVASLQRAEAAIYGPTSFRGSDISFRDRHFVARDGSFELKPAVRSQVRFRPGNLLDPGFAAGSGPYDIVFCRNLIIYQTDDARKSILRTLYGLTAPRGLLFVGHAELTSIMTERWTSVRQPCAFALMKSDGKTGAATGASPPAPPGPSRAQPPAFGAGRRSSGHRPRSGPSPADSGSSAVSPERPTLERASQLADQGRLAEATAVLEEILQHDRQNARAHFLLGIVQEAGGDTRSAEESLNRAIYLDADNVEALRHLVLLAERRGDAAAARRLRGRAERILSRGRGAP